MMQDQNRWCKPLLDAIPLRHSVRTFLPEPLPEAVPKQLEDFSDVDIGMCASHLWLGFVAKGYHPIVTPRLDADRVVWSFQLA